MSKNIHSYHKWEGMETHPSTISRIMQWNTEERMKKKGKLKKQFKDQDI
jgi:hypothetical protein